MKLQSKTNLKRIFFRPFSLFFTFILMPINYLIPQAFDFILFRKTTINISDTEGSISHRDFGPDSRSVAKGSLLKEPSTIIWLNSFIKNKSLLDIGASVGVFSLYAAKIMEAEVVALEPNAPAFSLLCLNINDNNLGKKITPYPLAASSTEGFSSLFMTGLKADAGGSSFEQPIDARGELYEPDFIQGTYSICLDSLLNKHSSFDYVKIDTDGNEIKVLKGMSKILSSTNLKSMLIELNENSEEYAKIISLIQSYGFVLDEEITKMSYISLKRGGRIYNHIFNK